MKVRPQKRVERLVVKELDGEILVYDLDNDEAHCLNGTASAVWKQCNGNATPAQVANRLQGTCPGLTEELVLLALAQLQKRDLLVDAVTVPGDIAGLSRREALKRFGLTAGAALMAPLITSIVAPTPAQAASCGPAGPFSQCNGVGQIGRCCQTPTGGVGVCTAISGGRECV